MGRCLCCGKVWVGVCRCDIGRSRGLCCGSSRGRGRCCGMGRGRCCGMGSGLCCDRVGVGVGSILW